jgi:hypothetical protein
MLGWRRGSLAHSGLAQHALAKHLRIAHPAPHQFDHARRDRLAAAGVPLGQIKHTAEIVEGGRHGVRYVGFEDGLISEERKDGAHGFGFRVEVSALMDDSWTDTRTFLYFLSILLYRNALSLVYALNVLSTIRQNTLLNELSW